MRVRRSFLWLAWGYHWLPMPLPTTRPSSIRHKGRSFAASRSALPSWHPRSWRSSVGWQIGAILFRLRWQMVLYLLDGLILIFLQDWFGVVFHAYALFCLWSGFMAQRELNKIERELRRRRSQ